MRAKVIHTGRIALGILASITLGWLALRGVELQLVINSFSRISPAMLILSLLVFMGASYLRAARWRLMFLSDEISIGRLFIVQHEGLGLSNVMPLRVASEITQLAVLTLRDGIKRANAIAALGMERIVDAIASTSLLGASFFLVPEMQELGVLLWGTISMVAVMVTVLIALVWGTQTFAFARRVAFVADISDSVTLLWHHRGRLAISLAMSYGYWILVGLTAWIIAEAIDLQITPISATLVIMGTIFFATAVPAAPAAAGTFEFAVVYVLGILGIDKAEGFSYAIIIHALLFLPATVIAAVFLPREGVISLRGKLTPTP